MAIMATTTRNSHAHPLPFLSCFIATLLFLLFLSLPTHTLSKPSNNPNIQSQSINHLTLLLPYTTARARVKHRLEAFNGCFKWQSNNPELIVVDQVSSENTGVSSQFGEKCSNSAFVGVAPGVVSGDRLSTWVTAEDLITGNQLRCEVFVDKISKITLQTTTRTMFKDDVEKLEIQASDQEGNIFSTLRGIEIQWQTYVGERVESRGKSVLSFSRFSDSSIESDAIEREMENEGLQSSSILVQGVEIGRSQVSARLTENLYSEVQPAVASISVVEPLQIYPGHLLYVPIGSRIQYRLQSRKRGVVEDIPVPNAVYAWSTSNQTVGTVDSSGLFVASQLGKSEVKVQHVNMSESEAHTFVNVVVPDHILFHIEPISTPNSQLQAAGDSSDWYLITSHRYSLKIEVYDKENHKITHSMGNMVFQVNIPSDFITVQQSSNTNDLHTILALTRGSTSITASLTHLLDPHTSNPFLLPTPHISTTQEIFITSHVKIISTVPIYLPYDVKNKHSYQIQVEGGSGEYIWSSTDTSIALVTASTGFVLSQNKGQTTITVFDKKNLRNSDSCLLYVLTPSKILIRRGVMEVEIGQQLTLEADLYHNGILGNLKEPTKFHNSTAIAFEWSVSDATVFSSLEGNVKSNLTEFPPSTSRSHRALKMGSVSATVKQSDLNLQSSLQIFSFPPLQLISSEEKNEKSEKSEISKKNPIALVTIGSTATFVFEGGPLPWHEEPNKHYDSIKIDSPQKVKIIQGTTVTNIKSSIPRGYLGNGIFRFDIVCLDFSEQSFVVTVGNQPSSSNPYPASSTIEVKFACQQPKSLRLYIPDSRSAVPTQCGDTAFALFEPPTLSSISLSHKPQTVYKINNNDDVTFYVAIFDHQDRPFTNASSLFLDWTSSMPKLAFWEPLNSIEAFETLIPTISPTQFPLIVPKKVPPMKNLHLGNEKGDVVISVTATKYDQEILKRAGISTSSFSLATPLPMDSIELSLISSVVLSPDHATIYLDPKNIVKILAIGGTGSYNFNINDTQIVSTQPARRDNTVPFLEISPVKAGVLKVMIDDVCASTPSIKGVLSSVSIITISEVHSLHPTGRNMVQIGKSIEIKVFALDSVGNKFPSSQYKYMNITATIDDRHTIQIEKSKNDQDEATSFVVHGLVSGTAKIVFSLTNPLTSHFTSSKPFHITVFPPLLLSPRILYLVKGGYFQVQWSGGPPIGAEIVFRTADDKITSLDADGMAKGIEIGETTLYAHVEAFDSLISKKEIFGEDSIRVIVRNLTNFRIHTTTTKILEGNEIKLRVSGSNGETPFTYGVLDLDFRWETLNPQVVGFIPLFKSTHKFKEHEGDVVSALGGEGDFSVLVRGLSPGTTRVSVRITNFPNSLSHLSTVSASIQITVHPLLSIQDQSIFTTHVHQPITHTYSHGISNNLLLLPPNAKVDILDEQNIVTEKHLVKVHNSDCQGIVNIDNGGLITSSEKLGNCHVIFEDRDYDQLIPLRIRVKPINSVLMHHKPGIENFASFLEVGKDTHYLLQISDDFGTPFQVFSDNLFSFETTTSSIVSTEFRDNGLLVKGLREGVEIIRVFVTHTPSIEDYIRVVVGRIIHPESPVLHLGGSIVFSTTPEERNRNIWSSSDSKVFDIDPSQGVGEGKSVGVASVLVNHTPQNHARTDVNVVKINDIQIEPKEIGFVAMNVPLSFIDSEGRKLTNTHNISQNIVYTCKILEGQWATSIAFNFSKVSEYCTVVPTGYINEGAKDISQPTHLTLVVTASDNKNSYTVSAQAQIPFTPQFYILGNTRYFSLSTEKTRTIEILTPSIFASSVNVISHNTSLVTVQRQQLPFTPKEGSVLLSFELQANTEKKDFDIVTIEIYNSLTNQRERIFAASTYSTQKSAEKTLYDEYALTCQSSDNNHHCISKPDNQPKAIYNNNNNNNNNVQQDDLIDIPKTPHPASQSSQIYSQAILLCVLVLIGGLIVSSCLFQISGAVKSRFIPPPHNYQGIPLTPVVNNPQPFLTPYTPAPGNKLSLSPSRLNNADTVTPKHDFSHNNEASPFRPSPKGFNPSPLGR